MRRQVLEIALGAAVAFATSCATVTKRPVQPPDTPDLGTQLEVDQQPTVIRQTKPRYPPDAFYKRIEGTVELEILIDRTGRVSRTRVVKSIPGLDEAAIQCVIEWQFRPAQLHGQPVATVASAPITFKITEKK